MANSFDESIIEGFICPKCLRSFGSPLVLRSHFEQEHQIDDPSANYENINGSAGDQYTCQAGPSKSCAFYDKSSEPHSLGTCSSLTIEFLKLRKVFVNRYALEANNLLIRLEKLCSMSFPRDLERKSFEQTIVPWVDSKVSLCPSCGNAFGFGAELAYPCEGSLINSLNIDDTNRSALNFWFNRKKMTQIAGAILDYNPIYRRRHHCRLCGHVLCADCSYFLPIIAAQQLLSSLNQKNLELFPLNYLSEGFLCASEAKKEQRAQSLKQRSSDNSSDYKLRICKVCKELLGRKFDNLRLRSTDCSEAQAYTELKQHMAKVTETLPNYTAIAESLNSGEQKFALEVARTIHSELLQSLQKVESLGREFEKSATVTTANRTSIRLATALSRYAKNFVQINLPPLRVLPTIQQYDCLTAQRKEELAARWSKEDQALAQLTERVTNTQRKQLNSIFPITFSTSGPKIWQKIIQSIGNTSKSTSVDQSTEILCNLATQIDILSQRLMEARNCNQTKQADELATELSEVEYRYLSLNSQLNK